MQQGRRYKIYPTPAQAASLRRWTGCQRFVYNAKREEQRYQSWLKRRAILSPSWHQTGGLPAGMNGAAFDQTFAQFKTETTGFLRTVPAVILRNAVYRFKTALSNHWKNPAHFGWPVAKGRHGPQSVPLTREVFHLDSDGALTLGNKKHALGKVAVRWHRPHGEPAMLAVSVTPAGDWHVSFSFEDDAVAPVPVAATATVGVDLGITQTVTASDGRFFNLTPTRDKREEARARRRALRLKRLERQLARRQKGSRRREKTKRKVARIKQHAAEVRRDFAEQVSHRLLADSPVTSAVVFENLSLRNMTRSAKGSLEAPGKNVAQKTGLNRELLARSLARIAERTAQKAVQRGRICLRVPAAYSSQTCAVCGHVSAKTRPSQARFHCRACGHQDHADANASEVIAQRGLAVLGLRPSGSAGRKTPVEGFYGARRLAARPRPRESGQVQPLLA